MTARRRRAFPERTSRVKLIVVAFHTITLPPMSRFAARSATALAVVLCASASTLVAQGADGVRPAVHIASGITAGSLRYAGGRTEDALSAVLQLRMPRGFSLSIEPTVARASEPAGTGNSSLTNTGLTDIPVGLSWERGFGGMLAPTIEVALGATIPVGDTATGFGTGALGSSVGIGGGITPTENLGLYASAGHTLSSFAAQSAFNGGGSGWGDVGASYQVGERVSVLAGFSTDLGAVDTTLGRGRSLSAGMSYNVAGPWALNIETSRGISGATPEWSAVVGIGTAFGSLDGARELRSAFGGGRHGLKKSGVGSSASNGRGRRP